MSEKNTYLKADFYQKSREPCESTPRSNLTAEKVFASNSKQNPEQPFNISLPRDKGFRLLASVRRISFSNSPENLSETSKQISFGESPTISLNQKNPPIDNIDLKLVPSQIRRSNKHFTTISKNNYSPLSHRNHKPNHEENSLRISTPSFQNQNTSRVQELKEMCEKLIIEQEKMKEQINSQNSLLEKLNSTTALSNKRSKINLLEEVGVVPRTRSMLRRALPIRIDAVHESESTKLMSARNHFSSKMASLNSSSRCSPRDPREQESVNLPFMIGFKGDIMGNTRLSPMKYYKDKPKMIKHSKLPKDIFTIRK